jgi:hypothetical protein
LTTAAIGLIYLKRKKNSLWVISLNKVRIGQLTTQTMDYFQIKDNSRASQSFLQDSEVNNQYCRFSIMNLNLVPSEYS